MPEFEEVKQDNLTLRRSGRKCKKKTLLQELIKSTYEDLLSNNVAFAVLMTRQEIRYGINVFHAWLPLPVSDCSTNLQLCGYAGVSAKSLG